MTRATPPASPARDRDLALDLLRGYFLVVIMIDHLRYAGNPLYFVSGHQSLWVTAAEGFVLISGFLVGRLRGDEARAAGLASAARHTLRRAGVLAGWCAGLTIAFRVISELTGYWPVVPNADSHGGLVEDLVGAVTLRHTYGDHNLLAAYALFLVLAPLVLAAMLRGWTTLALAASLTLWVVGYVFHLTWSDSVQSDLCWQLLFVTGMVAGFHRAALITRWDALPPRLRQAIAAVAVAASLAILVLSVLRLPIQGVYPTRFEGYVFDRNRLGPARFGCAIILVTTMYAVIRRFEAPLVRTIGAVLVPLGQASLYVYILQSILTFVLVNRAMHRPWLALAITLGMIGAVWTMVRYRVLFRVVPR